MVEHCDSNRQMIIDTYVHNSYEAEFAQPSTPALEALVQVRKKFHDRNTCGYAKFVGGLCWWQKGRVKEFQYAFVKHACIVLLSKVL